MFDSEDVLEAMRGDVEQEVSEGQFECETEDCNSESFDVNLYVADGSRFEGTAVCRECNERHELNIPVDGTNDMDDAAQDLEDALDDLDDSL